MNLASSFKENNSIRLGLTADSWQDAVHKAVEPLIDSGAVTEDYYQAIIASTEKYGPYYILMPGMAMPHAEAGVGVNKDSFALITLTKPVAFSDGKEVSVLLTLAAKSAAIHTTVAIPQIIALFELDNSIQRLLDCQTPEGVLEMVEESKSSPYLEGLDLES
ncbi:PTS sugar transporter subunit IIA [Streptococcus sobrinus]|uniref:PTS sugar transporter subunit IIA n=2 Tax=Streptococcus sobrinus TaxID=1310 RepID=UPI0003132C85|nr:PTS sugar transporter subunit IIA [Streptococcus sobrinus]OZV23016.1 PTS ascorbate transporter subunit IIA [Streptococcus sobrinus]